MKQLVIVSILFTAGFFTQINAQSKKVLADKIVGQVGDKIILRSDIINTINDVKGNPKVRTIQIFQQNVKCWKAS